MESGMTRIERMVELKKTIIYYEIIIKSNFVAKTTLKIHCWVLRTFYHSPQHLFKNLQRKTYQP